VFKGYFHESLVNISTSSRKSPLVIERGMLMAVSSLIVILLVVDAGDFSWTDKQPDSLAPQNIKIHEHETFHAN